SMGAFTNKEFYIGLIIIISVIGAYIFIGIKLLNKRENYYKKNLKSEMIRVKYDILDDTLFIEEGNIFRNFKVSNIENFIKNNKGIFLSIKTTERKNEAFYIVKDDIFTEVKLSCFYKKLVKLVEGKSKEKINSNSFSILKKLSLVIIIVSWPLTAFLVPKIAPKYYTKIHNEKVMQIIKANLYEPNQNQSIEQY
ncbi:MAG: hypothetical protein ACRCWM_05060, partial [Sarcina sp.]